MKDINLKIDKQNILLIGATNSGKTFFVKNKMIPFLEKKGYKVIYFEDCDEVNPTQKADIFIIDEVELLLDKSFLESSHPEEIPFYTEAYLGKVKKRHSKLSQIKAQVICIITRNNEREIDYLSQTYKKLEWNNSPVTVVKFVRDKIMLTD